MDNLVAGSHYELEDVHKDCPSISCQEYRDYFESNAKLALERHEQYFNGTMTVFTEQICKG